VWVRPSSSRCWGGHDSQIASSYRTHAIVCVFSRAGEHEEKTQYNTVKATGNSAAYSNSRYTEVICKNLRIFGHFAVAIGTCYKVPHFRSLVVKWIGLDLVCGRI
jgi:hypothetical protein